MTKRKRKLVLIVRLGIETTDSVKVIKKEVDDFYGSMPRPASSTDELPGTTLLWAKSEIVKAKKARPKAR